jgi:lipopolysaccharide assembly outer membrane protein LptD (OstA)
MKRFGLPLAAAFTAAIFSLPLCSQTGSSAGGIDTKDAKHFLTSLPHGEGRLTFVADNIEREWVPAIVHLKGNVRVEIWTSPKNGRSITVLRADEVDYNESTGKFSPHGNVSLTVEEAK